MCTDGLNDKLVYLHLLPWYLLQVLIFYQSVASPGTDFVPVVSQSVIIPDGAREVPLPVTILGDSVPELNESLLVTLTGVELTTPTESAAMPVLGSLARATLVILENDDPRGIFVVETTDGRSEVRVVEPESLTLGVTLVVRRERGSIGRVSVAWSVTGGSATQGEDFTGEGSKVKWKLGVMVNCTASYYNTCVVIHRGRSYVSV